MVLVRSYDEVKNGAYSPGGYEFVTKTEFFSTNEELGRPTAYLVEVTAGQEIRPHFHPLDQFQVFVAGGGTMGPQQIAPVSVHYAGAHTGYGPILSGDEGISFVTLRPPSSLRMKEQGGRLLPERRAEQQEREKPPAHGMGVVEPLPTPITAGSASVVLAESNDGFAADAIALAAGESWHIRDAGWSADTYLLGLSGRGSFADHDLAYLTCVFAAEGEDTGPVTAGDDGLHFLALRFPLAPERTTG